MVSGGDWVDFESSFDGPVIETGGETGRVPIAIDDLYLCEKCVRDAAGLVGMEFAPDLRGQVSEQRKQIEALEQEIRAKDRALYAANKTVEAAIKWPISKPTGKVGLAGPPEVAPEIAQLKKSRKRSEARSGANRG